MKSAGRVFAAAMAVAWGASGCGGSAPPPPPANTPAAAEQRVIEQRFEEAIRDRGERPRLSPEDALRQEMLDMERQYQADPSAPDAPAYLMAVGNLALSRFNDDVEAVRCFELIVLNHADWAGAPAVYPLLAAAYERMGRQDDLRWIYTRMTEVFPPHTPEHQFAQAELGLEPTPIPPDPDELEHGETVDAWLEEEALEDSEPDPGIVGNDAP